jgi:hypothetical protein
MHRTLKQEATRPAGMNILQQQARFDDFIREFNEERPHQAIGMKCPAEVYTPAAQSYQGLPRVEYPLHDRDVLVTACGRICMHRKRVNISTVLGGQRLGIKEVDDGIWLVSFLDYDLGYIDLEQKTLQTLDNPFGTRLLHGVIAGAWRLRSAMAQGSCPPLRWKNGLTTGAGPKHLTEDSHGRVYRS